jgi:hypothetical protein
MNEQTELDRIAFSGGRFNTTANLVKLLVLKATSVFRDVTSCVLVEILSDVSEEPAARFRDESGQLDLPLLSASHINRVMSLYIQF